MPPSPEQANNFINGPIEPKPEIAPVDVDSLTPEQKARLARLQALPEMKNTPIEELARVVLAEEEVERNNPEEE